MNGRRRTEPHTQELRAQLARMILALPVHNLRDPELMATVAKSLELLVPGSKWSDVSKEQLVLITQGKL